MVNATARASAPGFAIHHQVEQQLRALLRYAALAPSTRNSQPWRFALQGATVWLRSDPSRWLTVADAERRELHLSLGCALENLLVAAGHYGFRHVVSYFPDSADPDLAAMVTFTPGPRLARPAESALDTLEQRYTERRPFLAQAITAEVIERLCDIQGEAGVRLELSDAAARRRDVDVLNVRALGTLFGNGRYREELARCIGQGNSGGPWLNGEAGRLVLPHVSLARRIARQESLALLSAPLLGMIGTLADGPADHLRSGRLLQRLWLRATSLGLSFQPVSQALQVPTLRAALASQFPGAGQFPQQLVRIGYAPGRSMQPTTRRALEDVLTPRA